VSSAIVDTQLVRERRDALNLSQRAVGKALGVSSVLIRALETNPGSHPNLTLGFLERLADVLGIQTRELLAPRGATAPNDDDNEALHQTDGDDVARLLASLMDDARIPLTHRDDLALVLGWPLEQLQNVVQQTKRTLSGLGMHLHINPGDGYAVRASHGVLTAHEQLQLARARSRRRAMSITAARVLRAIALGDRYGEWRRGCRNPERVAIQALLKRGLIEEVDYGLRLTDPAADSLLITDRPSAASPAPSLPLCPPPSRTTVTPE
jgi:transcriptional regulator with XRE-family HTH domain